MVQVDARGDQCPVPVIKTKKAIESLSAPDTIEVLVDSTVSLQNVTKLGESQGAAVTSRMTDDGVYHITIDVKTLTKAADIECTCDTASVSGDTVVAVSSSCMGCGSEELGKILMKGFIFALTQLETPPQTILFYNGGASITTEGSESLEDLKNLEKSGTKIMTCGTCLDYYKLKDKLAVGTVTNMYVITETLSKAGRILRP